MPPVAEHTRRKIGEVICQLLAVLAESSLSAEQIADRTSCSIDSVRQTLDGDKRFVCNSRGLWSLDKA